CCHWNTTDCTPLGSVTVPIVAVSGSVVLAASGATVGAPVAGCGAGAAVALPVNANDCVPALFVATRFADFAPVGATGLNVTSTVQLPPRGRLVVHVVVPMRKLAASVPVNVNRVVAVNVSGLRPPFVR